MLWNSDPQSVDLQVTAHSTMASFQVIIQVDRKFWLEITRQPTSQKQNCQYYAHTPGNSRHFWILVLGLGVWLIFLSHLPACHPENQGYGQNHHALAHAPQGRGALRHLTQRQWKSGCIWGFPKMGEPQIIHLNRVSIINIINHPAIGVPPF